MEEKKAPRQHLTKVVDLLISPTRVRSFMDRDWVNRKGEATNNQIKTQLLAIKQENCPFPKPSLPTALVRGAGEEERKKYLAERLEVKKLFKNFNRYESERYVKLQILHAYCKQLQKLHDLLLKDKLTPLKEEEVEKIKAQIFGTIPPRKEGETETEYEKRVAKFRKPQLREGETEEQFQMRSKKFLLRNFSEVKTPEASYNTPAEVQKEIDLVISSNPDLEHFFSKDDVSKQRIRFNDAAAVAIAAVMEEAVYELMDHAIDNTLTSQRKHIQPDHCASPGVEKLPLFPLVSTSPHFQAVVERQKRKKEYLEAREREKVRVLQQAKRKALQAKKPLGKNKFEYPSFPEVEVENGFAILSELPELEGDEEGKKHKYFQWLGIDLESNEEDEHNIDFKFYVNKVCKRVLDERIDTSPFVVGNMIRELRVSSNIKKFFSDLIIDFIVRITPLAMLFIKTKKSRTISDKVVMTVIEMLLLDATTKTSEFVELGSDHKQILETVAEKVRLCQDYQTGVVPKEETNGHLGHTSDPTEAAGKISNGVKPHIPSTAKVVARRAPPPSAALLKA